MIPYAIYMNTGYFTVQLEMTHGLDFKTPKFPHHVIYSRYCLDEDDIHMQNFLYMIFWMSYAMFVETAFLN